MSQVLPIEIKGRTEKSVNFTGSFLDSGVDSFQGIVGGVLMHPIAQLTYVLHSRGSSQCY